VPVAGLAPVPWLDAAAVFRLCKTRTSVAKESVVQADMTQMLGEVLHAALLASPTKPRYQLVDRHLFPSIGTRKPDLVAYLLDYSSGAPVVAPFEAGNIAFIVELKARLASGAGFTDGDMGHLLDMMTALARAQPWRAGCDGSVTSAVVGALCDGVAITVYRAVFAIQADASGFTATLISAQAGPVQNLCGDGGVLLAKLLCAPPDVIGFALPTFTLTAAVGVAAGAAVAGAAVAQPLVVTPRSCLGFGATALVYLASSASLGLPGAERAVAIKSYIAHNPATEDAFFEAERASVAKVAMVPGCIQLAGSARTHTWSRRTAVLCSSPSRPLHTRGPPRRPRLRCATTWAPLPRPPPVRPHITQAAGCRRRRSCSSRRRTSSRT
jgi:hypothetical protein